MTTGAAGSNRPVRLLFVTDERAWPPTSGYRRRTRQTLLALSEIGHVTWVAAVGNRLDDGSPLEVPSELADRIDAVFAPAPGRRPAATAVRWLTTGRPWPLASRQWSAADRELGRMAGHRFDLAWAMGLDALHAIGRAGIDAGATMVDADLESLKLSRQLSSGSVSSLARRIVARVDVARWQRLEHTAAGRLDGFSVCSEDERRRLGGKAFVTPNSYPDPGIGRRAEVERRVLVFIGSMSYEPNRDAVAWFVDQVLGRVRNHRPDAVLRVVGAGPPLEGRLGSVDGVEVVGPVDDIGAELAAAAAVVVPIRWGAGTRVKILEAIAHRVPVVTTTIGAEGLDLVDQHHLLVADDADGFAAACGRVLDGGSAIADLTDRAHEAFLGQYDETMVIGRLQRRLHGVLVERRSASEPRPPADRPVRGPRSPRDGGGGR